jgi:hypothetical protein
VLVKMDESKADPPKALMDAMGEHVGAAIADSSFVDGGGLQRRRRRRVPRTAAT